MSTFMNFSTFLVISRITFKLAVLHLQNRKKKHANLLEFHQATGLKILEKIVTLFKLIGKIVKGKCSAFECRFIRSHSTGGSKQSTAKPP